MEIIFNHFALSDSRIVHVSYVSGKQSSGEVAPPVGSVEPDRNQYPATKVLHSAGTPESYDCMFKSQICCDHASDEISLMIFD